eukprot:11926376-Ditylum_brightwellii.AAC.1
MRPWKRSCTAPPLRGKRRESYWATLVMGTRTHCLVKEEGCITCKSDPKRCDRPGPLLVQAYIPTDLSEA